MFYTSLKGCKVCAYDSKINNNLIECNTICVYLHCNELNIRRDYIETY